MTIVEFLTARLDEDEAAARAASTDEGGRWGSWTNLPDPARVLREVAAKRAIVELHYSWDLQVAQVAADRTFGPILKAQASAAEAILRRLAAVHADHPDYLEEWRP